MKEQIIKRLIALTDKYSAYKNDFYKCDLSQIVQHSEYCPFFWRVGDSGSNVVILDVIGERERLLNNEGSRYDFMQNPMWRWELVATIGQYHVGNNKLFYYDGDTLEYVKPENEELFKKDYEKYINGLIDDVKKQYPNEKYNLDIPMYFDSVKTRALVRKMCEDKAKEKSLLACLHRLKSWRRTAKNMEIRVCIDHWGNDKSDFVFGEYTNGNLDCNGGIIWHDESGKYQIHT